MDRAIVIQAQHGDQAAFAGLMEAVGVRLHRTAIGILRDRALADDATQQALLAIWRHLPKLRDPDRFESWAYRLLVNACHAESRRERRRLPGLAVRPARDGEPFDADEPTAPDDLSSVHDRDELERGFRRLTVDERAIVVLRLHLDLPPDKVAEALGIPVGTVHSRLHRALRGLRAALEADARTTTVPTSREVAR